MIYTTLFCYIFLLPIEIYYITLIDLILLRYTISWIFCLIINYSIILLPYSTFYNRYYNRIATLTESTKLIILVSYVIPLTSLCILTILQSYNLNDLRHLCLLSYGLTIFINVKIITDFIDKPQVSSAFINLTTIKIIKIHEINYNALIDVYKNETDPDFFKTLSCVICSELFIDSKTQPISSANCEHYFHTECITTWYKQKADCPICRTPAYLVI